jgi:hypothetical protein
VNTVGKGGSGGGVKRSGTRGVDFAGERSRDGGMNAFGRLCMTEKFLTVCVSCGSDWLRLMLRGEAVGLINSIAVADLAS